jgi:hypothetical protein
MKPRLCFPVALLLITSPALLAQRPAQESESRPQNHHENAPRANQGRVPPTPPIKCGVGERLAPARAPDAVFAGPQRLSSICFLPALPFILISYRNENRPRSIQSHCR